MANLNAPRGFIPIKSASGGAHVAVNYYTYASNATRIGKGDLLVLTSGGGVAKETSAVAVGPWIGVAMCDSGVISAQGTIPVCDDLNQIYEVQGPSATLALTDLNRIVKVDASAATNSSTGLSGAKLTNTAATASNGVRILRLSPTPGNAFGAYQKLEVKLNSTSSAPGYPGV